MYTLYKIKKRTRRIQFLSIFKHELPCQMPTGSGYVFFLYPSCSMLKFTSKKQGKVTCNSISFLFLLWEPDTTFPLNTRLVASSCEKIINFCIGTLWWLVWNKGLTCVFEGLLCQGRPCLAMYLPYRSCPCNAWMCLAHQSRSRTYREALCSSSQQGTLTGNRPPLCLPHALKETGIVLEKQPFLVLAHDLIGQKL